MPGAGYFDGKTHILPLRIYYEDTDAEGIVYYANYLKFYERGRSDAFRLAAIDLPGLMSHADGIMFVVRSCDLDYRKPAKLGDALTIHTTVPELKGASMTFEQTVEKEGDVLNTARIRVGVLTLDGRPARLPKEIKDLIARALLLDK